MTRLNITKKIRYFLSFVVILYANINNVYSQVTTQHPYKKLLVNKP